MHAWLCSGFVGGKEVKETFLSNFMSNTSISQLIYLPHYGLGNRRK